MEKFDTNTFQGFLSSSIIGRKLIYEEVTGSTMDDARRLAHNVTEYPHGTAILSERQTKARGAKNHTWDASNTGNIYASFILHLPPFYKTKEGINDLEVLGCIAVLDTVHKYGVAQAVPKWPNDIWIKGHKLAGFLAEDGRFDIPGSQSSLLILGMGVNVNADVRRNGELSSIATSIVCEKDGQIINREKFFADVCSALEAMLCKPKEELLSVFKKACLFQEHCKISVSSLSGGAVIDADFIEVCSDWDIKFLDNATKSVVKADHESYSVRPKVVNKIVVISSGTQNTSANFLSKWLMSIVDTSKYVVCLVPETAVTGSDLWMKNCSLLVLTENTGEPEIFGNRLGSYLKSGGSILACGMGSLFLAKYLGVQTKEFLLDSSVSETNVDFVRVQVQQEKLTPENEDGKQTPLIGSSSCADYIVFPTSPLCFQFYQDEKAMLFENACVGKWGESEYTTPDGISNETHFPNKALLKAFYADADNTFQALSIFLFDAFGCGKVGLFGFDAGVECPVVQSESAVLSAVHSDRFKRDKLIMQILEVLLK